MASLPERYTPFQSVPFLPVVEEAERDLEVRIIVLNIQE
jgi:hypothetical protein